MVAFHPINTCQHSAQNAVLSVRASIAVIWMGSLLSGSNAAQQPSLVTADQARFQIAALAGQLRDANQLNAAKARYAKSLGAELFVQGIFAAIPNGIGITLVADDRLAGGDSRFEVLAEVPLTNEMKELQPSPVPERTLLGSFYRAGTAGIGTPVCEQCAQPRYCYVARAKGLAGVVILEIGVTSQGTIETVTLIRAPDPALATAAIQTIRTWQFKPATNALGEFVPVIMNVAVSFRRDEK